MCLASVLCPLRCSTLGVLPLGDQGADFTPWSPLSRRHVLLFPICARGELTPPICRPPPGPHAGSSLAEGTPTAAFLCPGTCDPPSFGDIIEPFDTSAVVYTCSSSRRTPDPLVAGLFPQSLPTPALNRHDIAVVWDLRLHGDPGGPTSITNRARIVPAIFYIVITFLSGHTTHWAPASGPNVEALAWERMLHTDWRKPTRCVAVHPFPVDTGALASTP